ncbi:hypothetical protein HN789_00610 [archaeon]|nr:hypothetical protein [archaeon]MBT4022030.1 hypothetical protein [archaeon]MBT4272643.1 hypothetical protein [archaeon]MBT4461441.1 hypothetical protein [archaeon]MBT4857789.1 hypothetical protein [archaeon]
MNYKTYLVFITTLLIVIPSIISDIPMSSSQLINIYYGDYDESLFEKHIDIPIVAVVNQNAGIVGRVRINLLKSNNNMVVLDSRVKFNETTISSILDSIIISKEVTKKQGDFFISYDLKSESISGKSTGASLTLGMIALLENLEYNKNSIVSGFFDESKVLQKTGGLPIKILSISNSQSDTIIIGPNQRTHTIYEKYQNKILTKNIDLQEYAKINNVKLVETSNLEKVKNMVLNKKL